MIIGILLAVTAIFMINNWLSYDPTLKKEIDSRGRLVALKDFDCKGHHIAKGTVGAFIRNGIEIDLRDDSWADAESELSGAVTIKSDSYVEKSKLHNWNVYNSEVIKCSCSGKNEALAGIYCDGSFNGDAYAERNWGKDRWF